MVTTQEQMTKRVSEIHNRMEELSAWSRLYTSNADDYKKYQDEMNALVEELEELSKSVDTRESFKK